MNLQKCVIKQGLFGRWVIVNAEDEKLAWSGSRWVPHSQGVPTGAIQVCNFDDAGQAEEHAANHGLELVKVLNGTAGTAPAREQLAE